MTTLDRFEELADGLNHPEGVAWNPLDHRVYAGGEAGELYRVSLEGVVEEVGATGGSMLGLAADGSGRVYACDAGKGEVARFDPASGAIETYARGPDGEALDTPNVAAFDERGNLYVTCSGESGRPGIVVVRPGGRTEPWTEAVPGYPNGCVVDPASSSLLVVEAHAQRVVRVPIHRDGSAGEPAVLATLPDTDPDGIALDADGNLWVTLYRPDGVVRITPSGAIDLVVDDHLASRMDAPTNLAFVGERLERAVIANVGARHLLVADLGAVGQPSHLPEVP